MANRKEYCLYCMVFDQPIPEMRALISSLEAVGCKDVMQGRPVLSIEFWLDTSLWEESHWMHWDSLIRGIHKGYGFNWERSCLPTQGINADYLDCRKIYELERNLDRKRDSIFAFLFYKKSDKINHEILCLLRSICAESHWRRKGNTDKHWAATANRSRQKLMQLQVKSNKDVENFLSKIV